VARLIYDAEVAGRRCTMHRLDSLARPAGHDEPRQDIPATPPSNLTVRFGDDSDVVVELSDDSLSVTVPLSSVRVMYYRSDAEGLWFSDDPRLLVKPGMSHDTRWLLAQIELAAPLAPFSAWKEIRCVPFGVTLTARLRDLCLRETAAPFFRSDGSFDGPLSDHARVDRLGDVLDGAIRRSIPQRRGVVLFSGGVDSGAIAARVARMGWQDLTLAHTRRFTGDPETANARRMAAALKLPFQVLDYSADTALANLPKLFDTCTTVNDFAVIWQSALARQVIEMFPGVDSIIDGTGSDAIFGGIAKWGKAHLLYGVPAPVRRAVGALYRVGGFWHRGGRAENVLRIIRRSALWPFPSFAVVLNPLGGIGYHSPRDVRRELVETLDAWLDLVACPLAPAVRSKLLGISVSNSASHCHKAVDLCDDAGVTLCFPFNDPGLVAFALQEVTRWPEELSEAKGALKQLLVRSVPASLVFRPKSGFSIHPADTFARPAFLNAFAAVLEDRSGPFYPLLKRSMLHRLYRALQDRRNLSWYTYEFVWALVFGHQWVTRIDSHVRAAHGRERANAQ
jgi:asparagine synthase (glutamine-hydrolysing)